MAVLAAPGSRWILPLAFDDTRTLVNGPLSLRWRVHGESLRLTMPVLIGCWTVSVGANGEARYARDVYDLDGRLRQALESRFDDDLDGDGKVG